MRSTVGDIILEINLRFLKLDFDRLGAFIESSFRSIRPSSTRNDNAFSVSLMSNCVDSYLSMYGRIRVNISKSLLFFIGKRLLAIRFAMRDGRQKR